MKIVMERDDVDHLSQLLPGAEDHGHLAEEFAGRVRMPLVPCAHTFVEVDSADATTQKSVPRDKTL